MLFDIPRRKEWRVKCTCCLMLSLSAFTINASSAPDYGAPQVFHATWSSPESIILLAYEYGQNAGALCALDVASLALKKLTTVGRYNSCHILNGSTAETLVWTDNHTVYCKKKYKKKECIDKLLGNNKDGFFLKSQVIPQRLFPAKKELLVHRYGLKGLAFMNWDFGTDYFEEIGFFSLSKKALKVTSLPDRFDSFTLKHVSEPLGEAKEYVFLAWDCGNEKALISVMSLSSFQIICEFEIVGKIWALRKNPLGTQIRLLAEKNNVLTIHEIDVFNLNKDSKHEVFRTSVTPCSFYKLDLSWSFILRWVRGEPQSNWRLEKHPIKISKGKCGWEELIDCADFVLSPTEEKVFYWQKSGALGITGITEKNSKNRQELTMPSLNKIQ